MKNMKIMKDEKMKMEMETNMKTNMETNTETNTETMERKPIFGIKIWQKDDGIDGILVTVGLCIIALLLCVVMKDSLSTFITTLVSSMTSKATTILNGTVSSGVILP